MNQSTNLQTQGLRFIRRGSDFEWSHPLEMLPADLDCTDMTDEQFEHAVRSAAPDTTRNTLVRRHAIAQDRQFAPDPVLLTGFGELCTGGLGE